MDPLPKIGDASGESLSEMGESVNCQVTCFGRESLQSEGESGKWNLLSVGVAA